MDILFDKIKWQYVSEEGRKWLDSLDGDSVRIERIKYTDQRSVYRHPAGIYVKRINYKRLRSIYKAFAGGNAANEGNIALTMKQRGVPVPEIMAFGRIKSIGILHEDVLVTREIANSMALREFIENSLKQMNLKEKNDVIKKFAEFMAKLHDQGIYHRDFHLNNILIQYQEGHIGFSILDLNKVILYPGPLSCEKRSKQLGILLSISWGLCSRNDRFRFLKNYIPGSRKKEKARLIKRITREAGNHIHDLLSQRTKQSVGTNTRFVQEIFKCTKVYRKRGFEFDSTLPEFCENKNFPWAEGRQNEDTGNFQLNDRICYFKKYSSISLTDRIWNVLGRRKGRDLWKRTWRFPFKKIPIPAPLMMICRKNDKFQWVYLLGPCTGSAQCMGI